MFRDLPVFTQYIFLKLATGRRSVNHAIAKTWDYVMGPGCYVVSHFTTMGRLRSNCSADTIASILSNILAFPHLVNQMTSWCG